LVTSGGLDVEDPFPEEDAADSVGPSLDGSPDDLARRLHREGDPDVVRTVGEVATLFGEFEVLLADSVQRGEDGRGGRFGEVLGLH
jgi:hypothetical protein